MIAALACVAGLAAGWWLRGVIGEGCLAYVRRRTAAEQRRWREASERAHADQEQG